MPSLLSRPRAVASQRAEARSATICPSGSVLDAQEDHSTPFAGVLAGLPALVPFEQEGRHLEAVVTGSTHVARVATRHEVLGVVVPGVSIDVIDGQRPCGSASVAPLNFDGAPVTRVDSGSDLVVQDHSVLGHAARSRSEGMVLALDVLVGHVSECRHNEEVCHP